MAELKESKVEPRKAVEPPVADAFENPTGYLKSKGWKCLGNPDTVTARWWDPQSKPYKWYTEEPQMAWNKAEGKMTQVIAPDGFGAMKPVVRMVVHPAGEWVTLQEALNTQLARDYHELQKAERERMLEAEHARKVESDKAAGRQPALTY